MNEMKKILEEIAKNKSVRILYACETGSRAWGFPSPDSDYDVRFIYMHDRDWYLSLSERKDTIEVMEGDLDITGWDLRKALLLLKKSNAPLIERFQSPIVYQAEELFRKEFKELIDVYYSPTAVFYHHYSLAQKFREELEGKAKIKLKSYFYMIRSLLSCSWIVEDKTVLPMDIEGLMTRIDAGRRDELRSLIKLKSGVGEKYLYQREENLDSWITGMFDKLDSSRNALGVNNESTGKLDRFFLKMTNNDGNN
jgi:predicted nucleotidyltransferase